MSIMVDSAELNIVTNVWRNYLKCSPSSCFMVWGQEFKSRLRSHILVYMLIWCTSSRVLGHRPARFEARNSNGDRVCIFMWRPSWCMSSAALGHRFAIHGLRPGLPTTAEASFCRRWWFGPWLMSSMAFGRRLVIHGLRLGTQSTVVLHDNLGIWKHWESNQSESLETCKY